MHVVAWGCISVVTDTLRTLQRENVGGDGVFGFVSCFGGCMCLIYVEMGS